MQKLFTEGFREEPQKQTEINFAPKSWEVENLEKTGELVYGIQAFVTNNFDTRGTKILKNKNITLHGSFNLDKINYFKLKKKKATLRDFFNTLLHGLMTAK